MPVVLLGIPLHVVSVDDAVEWITSRSAGNGSGQIVTSNLDFARLARVDPEMHRIHVEADLVVADGMPLVWLSRLFGPALPMRVAGSDLLAPLCDAARRSGTSVYALGAAPGVAKRALESLQGRFPGLRVAGCDSPPPAPLEAMNNEEILARIGDARPNLLLVAFGCPKQDKWIRNHRGDRRLPLSMGIGASLDFVVGVQTRAPVAIQRIGLEWLWRLALQPRRLLGRYVGDLLFLASMLLKLFWLRRSPLGRVGGRERPDRRKLEALGAVWIGLPPLRRPEEAQEFLDRLPAPVPGGAVVVDLSDRSWLNSLELGALLLLSRRGRVILAASPARLVRLIRLFRMDRFLRIPDSAAALEKEFA